MGAPLLFTAVELEKSVTPDAALSVYRFTEMQQGETLQQHVQHCDAQQMATGPFLVVSGLCQPIPSHVTHSMHDGTMHGMYMSVQPLASAATVLPWPLPFLPYVFTLGRLPVTS
ncbi:hypothetical protein HaLaN_05904, partial [Haematococcus lacustris]